MNYKYYFAANAFILSFTACILIRCNPPPSECVGTNNVSISIVGYRKALVYALFLYYRHAASRHSERSPMRCRCSQSPSSIPYALSLIACSLQKPYIRPCKTSFRRTWSPVFGATWVEHCLCKLGPLLAIQQHWARLGRCQVEVLQVLYLLLRAVQ